MYSIAVKIEGIERRRRSAGLLHIVIGFFLIAKGTDYYRYYNYENFLTILPVYLVALTSLIYGSLRKKLDPLAHYNYWLRLVQVVMFTVLGVLMINSGRSIDYISLFIWAFLCIALLFSERRIFIDTELHLSEDGLRIPGYYRDHFVPWIELTDIVIRHDFVTIFHHKQKYLQYQVIQSLSDLELAKINAFCKAKLERREEMVKANV